MSDSDYQLVRLANGTFSIHSKAEGETFHPVVGPVAEAEALYVSQLKLCDRVRSHPGDFVIWDVGLGAAANVLTALRATRELSCSLQIISFDRTLEPLRFALRHAAELGYLAQYESAVQALLETGRAEFTHGRQSVRWRLRLGDFPKFLSRPGAEPAPRAIMFDAFSPAKNPEMWTAPLFTDLFRALDPGRPCAMPTYSRSTMLRVTLLLAGFYVGIGHATGEKEETTIAANTLELIDEPLPAAWLRRARRSRSAEPLWEPAYRQTRLTPETWEKLRRHPQFDPSITRSDRARTG
jgi:tRNA U34 5-methylaminomethyl-2-thiouridine-forming methyltransferase MnmC